MNAFNTQSEKTKTKQHNLQLRKGKPAIATFFLQPAKALQGKKNVKQYLL